MLYPRPNKSEGKLGKLMFHWVDMNRFCYSPLPEPSANAWDLLRANCVCAYVLEWMLKCIHAHKCVFVVKDYCSYLNIISVCVDGGWLLYIL